MLRYLSKTNPNQLRGAALLRLDFNTADNWRLEAALPTVRFLAKNADYILIVSHRKRPDVTVKDGVPEGKDAEKYSLKKNAEVLGKLLKRKVVFIPHFRFNEIKLQLAMSPKGSIFLLENIRFLPGEAENDGKLGKTLAGLANYYVNDAFPVSHRANASLVAVTKYLPSYAGFGMEREITSLGRVVKTPKHPFVVIVGGGKAADKLEVIKNFRNKADYFLLGGAPANTMLRLSGVDVRQSLVDDDPRNAAVFKSFLKNKKVILPVDWKWDGDMILDIGDDTAAEYASIIKSARTILWAGPMGFFEKPKFAKGNIAIAKAVASNRKAFTLTGGGETVSFLKAHKLDKKFSFISTGGGAMIEFLAGDKLPGIEALK